MTVVAAAIDPDGTIAMAADTMSCYGDTALYGTLKAHAHDVGEGRSALIGHSGSGSLHAVVRRHWVCEGSPDPVCTDDEADAWADAVAEAIAAVAVEATPPVTDSDGAADGAVLLGYAGRVWVLSQQDAVPIYRAGRFAALGTGREVAVGVMHSLQALHQAEQLADQAVRITVQHIFSCGLPDGGDPLLLTLTPDCHAKP